MTSNFFPVHVCQKIRKCGKFENIYTSKLLIMQAALMKATSGEVTPRQDTPRQDTSRQVMFMQATPRCIEKPSKGSFL